MKTQNHNSDAVSSHVKEYSLGTIAVHETTREPIESQVVMSEKNFRSLLSMIPKTTERNAIINEIQRIKDLLTQSTFDATYNRERLIEILQDALNFNIFINDVDELNKQPFIVGKINLEDCV
jgi:hypothetical protein